MNILTTMMLGKEDNFNNWIECHTLCGDYHLVNKLIDPFAQICHAPIIRDL